MHQRLNSYNRQRGAVLAVCMIVLLLLTLLGLSGARSVVLQEKMTSASRDAQLALQAAEVALQVAEGKVYELTSLKEAAELGGYYGEEMPADLFNNSNWETAEKSTVEMNGHELNYSYFIMYEGELERPGAPQDSGGTQNDEPPVSVFRIVARGKGLGNTERILITHFGKKFR